jgi:polyferredoxin/tetratricopeptide (TPR) repeat protein
MAKNCTAPSHLNAPDRGTLDPATGVRSTRAGRWRAIVLIIVHVLIAIHVGHWLATGSTVTPLEPSEAMKFSQESVINAGAILFGLAILSTLVLGRWFCGWACHLVALQDFCRWLLLKIGVRPREVRLGLLGVVPWLAFVYMFVAPIVYRLRVGDEVATQALELTTTRFWATFPGLVVSILQLLCVGFVIVYFLGSKAFCTNGCPYGGIFGLVDQLAPMRIRVTDACEGCGHCTTSCSSNVLVHQEVKDYGAVVDPGCMKCMDCVNVCPKDALYVGFGAPAVLTSRRTPPPQAKDGAAGEGKALDAFLRTLLLALFIPAALYSFLIYDSPVDPQDLWMLSAGSLALAILFRGKAQRPSGYSLFEETLLAVLFLAAMLTFRGYRNAVPLLFSFGLSAMLSFLVVQGLRLFTRHTVKLQNIGLRNAGTLSRAGIAFGVFVTLVSAAWAYTGLFDAAIHTRLENRRGAEIFQTGIQFYHSGDPHSAALAFEEARQVAPDLADEITEWENHRAAVDAYNRGVQGAQMGDMEIAEAGFREALELNPALLQAHVNLGGVLCEQSRFEEGLVFYRQALELNPDDPDTHELLARAYRAINEHDKADTHFKECQRLRNEEREAE